MRLANLRGRAVLIGVDSTAIDVRRASEGRFPSDPQALFDDWDEFSSWTRDVTVAGGEAFVPEDLGAPVPRPPQVFAIGLNYAAHAAEAGYPPESMPVTFTKFPACLTGPVTQVTLPTETVDWEVELVIVLSRHTYRVSRSQAWDHVAGLTVGQDLSERTGQLDGPRPQFSLAKSYPGFGPTGPWLVTPDELPDPNDLAITCELSGRRVQSARTSHMLYDIPELIVRLSSVCPLLPGDVVFTGTPAGVGNARSPKEFLRDGDELVSSIEGIGTIVQTFAAAPVESGDRGMVLA